MKRVAISIGFLLMFAGILASGGKLGLQIKQLHDKINKTVDDNIDKLGGNTQGAQNE